MKSTSGGPLWERLSRDSLLTLLPELRDPINGLHQLNKKYGNSHEGFPMRWWKEREAREVGLPIVRSVHNALWGKAKPMSLPAPYQRRFDGSFTGLIAEHLNLSNTQLTFVTQVGDILRASGLVRRKNLSSGKIVWLVAPWDESKVKFHRKEAALSRRSWEEVEEQAAKGEQLAGKVIVNFDLKALRFPDPNPEAMVDYVERVTEIVKRQREELDRERAAREKAERRAAEEAKRADEEAKRADELEQLLEEATAPKHDWVAAVDKIKAIVGAS